MKRLFTMTLLLSLLLLPALCYGQEATTPKAKAIMIAVKISSEVGTKQIALAPKILTIEKKPATITVGNSKTELNDKEVKSDKDTDRGFYTRLEITPQVVENVSPALIKMEIRFSLTHNNYSARQSFQTVVRDGEAFLFESADKSKGQWLKLSISASIAGDKPDKPRSSTGEGEEHSSCRGGDRDE